MGQFALLALGAVAASESQIPERIATRRIHVQIGVGTGSPHLGSSNRVDVSRRSPIDEDARRLTIPDEYACPSPDVKLVSVPNKHAGADITVAEHADPGQEAGCG